MTGPRLKNSIGRLLKALEKELATLDGDIDDAVRGSPAWRAKENLLESVPGGAYRPLHPNPTRHRDVPAALCGATVRRDPERNWLVIASG